MHKVGPILNVHHKPNEQPGDLVNCPFEGGISRLPSITHYNLFQLPNTSFTFSFPCAMSFPRYLYNDVSGTLHNMAIQDKGILPRPLSCEFASDPSAEGSRVGKDTILEIAPW